MVELKDFLLIFIGTIFIVLGVRGLDLGGLEYWKYFLVIIVGVIFFIGAIMKKDIKKLKSKLKGEENETI